MRNKPVFLLWILLLAFGCEKEQVAAGDTRIDEDLAPYFERFRIAGAERGVDVDFAAARIAAFLETISTSSVTGQCYYNADEPNRLVIDAAYWRRASELKREFVVFHELGHCFLGRSHLETVRPDGTCASIMHSGLSDCRNAYGSETREDYLDELFLEK